MLGVLILSGCSGPETDTYKYKEPPPIPNPRPDPSDLKNMENLGKELRESMKMYECEEAKPSQINLFGNLNPDRVKDMTGGQVMLGESRGASYRDKDGAKGQLLHNGCPEEMVKAEAGDLEVVLIKNTIASAQKVLLCGNVRNSAWLTIYAGELVLKDFDFQVEKMGGVYIRTGNLVLEGTNKILTVETSSALLWLSSKKSFSVSVETGVEGQGTLAVESKVVTCAQVKENAAKEKL